MPPAQFLDWQTYRAAVRGGRKVAFEELRDQVLAVNRAGLGRAAIVDDLDDLLKDVDTGARAEDFEVVAEMIQRVSGFFSPHGAIHLQD